jgi:ABC-type branched-subunit amino acid transport system substrate-binding protein
VDRRSRNLHRRWLTLAVASLALSALTACNPSEQTWGDIVVPPNAPVVLGYSIDMDSGSSSAETPSHLLPPESNISGHPIELRPVPVHCAATQPAGMAPSADAISGLAGFIGAACSSSCVYAEGMLFQTKTTMIASGCTSDSVVHQGYSTVFRVAWTDADQAVVSAAYTRKDLGTKRVAVVYDSTAYGRSLMAEFEHEFRSEGGSISGVQIPNGGKVDAPAVAARAKSAGAQAVFFASGRSDSGAVFAELQPLVAPLPVVASDSVFGRTSAVPPNGLIAVGLDRREGAWRSELQIGANNPELFSAQSVDAEYLYVSALRRAAVRRADGSLVINRKQLRDALAGAKTSGETGLLSFSSHGERMHDTGAEIDLVDSGRGTPLRQYKR